MTVLMGLHLILLVIIFVVIILLFLHKTGLFDGPPSAFVWASWICVQKVVADLQAHHEICIRRTSGRPLPPMCSWPIVSDKETS